MNNKVLRVLEMKGYIHIEIFIRFISLSKIDGNDYWLGGR